MWYCYILRCLDKGHTNLTYNGSTNNPCRRLKQHLGILCGGAKATRGKMWEIYALMTGFSDHSNCLSAEWRIKHTTGARKRPAIHCGVHGRIKGLNEVLKLEKWTSKCNHDNKNSNLKVYVTTDVVNDLDLDALPDNIDVFTVKKFSVKLLKKIEDADK
jgi:predicted GIY-YIG superfamily endonuclease